MARLFEISTDSLAMGPSDTLTSTEYGDSLPYAHPVVRQDSLFFVQDTLFVVSEPPVAPEEVFGEASILVSPSHTKNYQPSVYESGVFQGVVLALALAYLFVIGRSLREMFDLFRKLSLNPSKSLRMTEIQGSSNTRFLWTMTIIGIPTIALFLMRAADYQLPLATLIPSQWIPLVGVGLVLTIAAIALYQVGFLWIAGNISLSQTTTSQLAALKFNYFALSTVLLCPFILLYTLTPGDNGKIMLYCTLTVLGIVLILYLKDSLTLFLSKKISILHWILYLCAVEIFPLSLIGFWMAKI